VCSGPEKKRRVHIIPPAKRFKYSVGNRHGGFVKRHLGGGHSQVRKPEDSKKKRKLWGGSRGEQLVDLGKKGHGCPSEEIDKKLGNRGGDSPGITLERVVR